MVAVVAVAVVAAAAFAAAVTAVVVAAFVAAVVAAVAVLAVFVAAVAAVAAVVAVVVLVVPRTQCFSLSCFCCTFMVLNKLLSHSNIALLLSYAAALLSTRSSKVSLSTHLSKSIRS